MGQPIFVLGKQRSGTTWLANQLSQHSQIAAVRNDHHQGIHESAYFSHVAGRYGDLSYKTNYVEFVEAMAVSDTVRILGIDKTFLYSLWPTTYEGVFQAMMTKAARAKGARYWLDKTPEHTLMADYLARRFPDARFIAITRDALEVMRSTVGRHHGRTQRHRVTLFRGTLNLVHHAKEIAHFAGRSDRMRRVGFESMVGQTERTFRELCEFLELAFEPTVLREAYAPNSTFTAGRGRGREKVLSKGDERLIRFALRTGRCIPLAGFRALRRATRPNTKKPLPKWFFSMYAPVFEEQGVTRAAKTDPAGFDPQTSEAVVQP